MLHSATRKQDMTTSIADRLAFYYATKPKVRKRPKVGIDDLRAALAPQWLRDLWSTWPRDWPLSPLKDAR